MQTPITKIYFPGLNGLRFIAAFLWDGNSFKTLRNKYDASFKERTAVEKEKTTETPAPASGIKD